MQSESCSRRCLRFFRCPWAEGENTTSQPLLGAPSGYARDSLHDAADLLEDRPLVCESPGHVQIAAIMNLAAWEGTWELVQRENWESYLTFLGVPPEAHEAAAKAPDFHSYLVEDEAFTMEHRIPAQNLHMMYRTPIDGELCNSPYPRITSAAWSEDEEKKNIAEPIWKNTWIEKPVCWKTELPDYGGKGKTVVFDRRLTSTEEFKMTLHVLGERGEVELGPCYVFMKKSSSKTPSPTNWLRAKGAPLKETPDRRAALEQVLKMVTENVDAISNAQTQDRVRPGRFEGSAAMLTGAIKFYQAMLPKWMAPEKLDDTCPAMLKAGVEADWEVIHEPKGIGLVIAPWNAPVLLSVIPMMGMLAAGNRVVIKPSEATPKSSEVLRMLCSKYLPGLVWVEQGGKEAVERLIDEGADHLVFTGGGQVAKLIAARAAKTLTPVTLELGGKSPVFIDGSLDDSMLQSAVAEVLVTKQAFSGQFCQSHDYVLVHEAVYDSFCAKLKAAIENMGDGRNVPLVNKRHYDRVKALLPNHGLQCLPPMEGSFTPDDASMTLPVTAILEPPASSPVMQEEIFGPWLPVQKVTGVDDAITRVNANPQGRPLVLYCYSQDPNTIDIFLSKTSSGNVAINAGPQRLLSNYHVGFGGVGESGCGVSLWGKEAFREFSNRKHVVRAKEGFAQSFFGRPPPQSAPAPAASQATSAPNGPALKGQVQKAFGAASQKSPMEDVFDQITKAEKFQEHFADVVRNLSEKTQKLLAVRTLLPAATLEVQQQTEVTIKKRQSILNGYRDFAEKKGVSWRDNAKKLEDRGCATWDEERLALEDPDLQVPEYYEKHGHGTLHSYNKGNCNWEAAFDGQSAYLLVHLHHYAEKTPQGCFDEIHKVLDEAGLKHLGDAESKEKVTCVDIGCGVGTSTFSTKKALDDAGIKNEITGVDLSSHFIAVARFLQKEMGMTEGLNFRHGDGLNLKHLGFANESVDVVTVSEVTHEMPELVSKRLMKEVARVLRPGGVMMYMDLNPTQIIKANPVSNLVQRIAMSNEPYFDQYLELDVEAAMTSVGLEIVERTWPNSSKYSNPDEECSLRILVAKKGGT